MKKKYFLLYTILISLLFLCKQAPKGPWSGEFVKINNYTGIFLSSDSYNFCREANDLKLLFDTSSIRQDRPAYLIIVHIISIPVKYITKKIEQIIGLKDKIDFQYLQSVNDKILKNPEFLFKKQPTYNMLLKYRYTYLSFVILNVFILFLTLWLFYKLLSEFKISEPLKIICLVLISINRVVKAYLFAAHMQLFILLTPVLFMYSIYCLYKSGFDTRKVFLHSILMGLLCLFYGSFIFYFPILFITSIFYFKRCSVVLSKWYVYLIAGVLCVLPTFLWVSVLTNSTGTYYNHEVEHYREYIWIKDKLSISFSAFIVTSIKFLFAFIYCILKSIVFYILVYLVVLYYANKKKLSIIKKDWFLQYNIMMILLFLLPLGFYQPRLLFIIAPILFLLTAVLLQECINLGFVNKQKLINVIYVIVLLQSIYVVFSNTYYQ